MIKINALDKSYGKHPVLNGLNLHLEKGEIYGFLGKNGAGKTTTMKILSGMIRPDHGVFFIEGSRGANRTSPLLGYLPEQPEFYPWLTADEYLDFMGAICGESARERRTRRDELLEQTNLKNARHRRIGGFSRGMKQRLGIATALYKHPRILLLDEPSSALDPEGRKGVLTILEQLREAGLTLLFSTHILSDVQRICTRIGILHNGAIVLEDTPDGMRHRYSQNLYDLEITPLPAEDPQPELMTQAGIRKIEKEENKLILHGFESSDPTPLISFYLSRGGSIRSLTKRQASLEEIFIQEVYHA